ncbi:MAG: 2,3-bisphosphoglycerate-independent phosphoglycerate mutase [Parcubacteria group bacterium GW2011_GWD2_43_10]|uniref:2,3-bisphosphoglycerate-independent phosphoglycerate mutase n=3 Tax=Candidatus Vebleniibacteriota TaxID=1817921 RepID=A0A1G2Q7J1_9BACT|nr:MAG: 2,3-bisphosphoglycerate-independent phosphoglycerate mutase [Parcubacteria group bacterium GW2011_GWA2_42_80]KKS82050.1 MAG: 2,3-bisphosphoglycerate-independent phosphoglycerate mutase [Parcubacteria group bacterium GW2011_GWD2_43_10]KKT14823.1 MAG: 2,3-bisphosphoglycerate-independent phosphoglycerate mutase [Parcubacteria group bacterium GW2011_GWF2_43_38]OHA55009.1 MAG: phosphoglycerate mutase (2,3-diphosphoglycerate-independent) [Candidatus Veblenbacteria bacterium RIFOXYB1_FULL_43_13
MFNQRPKPVVLVVLDGWGVDIPSRSNAISQAQTPVWQRLITTYPTFTLQAAGEAVGLPWGEVGNSEVGHLALGAGKILYHDLPRITRAIVDKSFFQNRALLTAIQLAQEKNSQLHLIGLVSPGGVHSSIDHLYALLEMAKQQGMANVFVHAFLDGRDTPFDSAKTYLEELANKMKKIGVGKIASIMGRYYAMDRDNHWDRVQAAYDCLVEGKGKPATSALRGLAASYAAKVFDEQVVPTVIMEGDKPVTTVGNNDSVIFFNFRADRARQLTHAFVLPGFSKFPRRTLERLHFVTMTEYENNIPVEVAFPAETIEYPLARIISEAGLKQLHLAETEKYAHVTYFFNGGREQAYEGEDHVLIPSPVVPSYDQKPEMSARAVTDRFLQEIRTGKYDFCVINFANADMVGHTGNLSATVRAINVLDECIGEVVAGTLEYGGLVIITADHGNAENLVNLQTGSINKEHSNNPVPCIIVARELENKAGSGQLVTDDLSKLTPAGVLADVAPTMLKIMGLNKPADMSGQSLL